MKKTGIHRTTRQRRMILEELSDFEKHPSAEEVFEAVRKKLPRISLGTVYRNLEVLCATGDINKLEFGGATKRFDGDPEGHYHIRCSVCDRVDNICLPFLKDMADRIDGQTGYRVIGHRLEFYGLCPECARNMVAPGLGKLLPSSRE